MAAYVLAPMWGGLIAGAPKGKSPKLPRPQLRLWTTAGSRRHRSVKRTMGPREESAYTARENSSMACARANPSRRSGMEPRAYSCRPGAPARSAGIAARPGAASETAALDTCAPAPAPASCLGHPPLAGSPNGTAATLDPSSRRGRVEASGTKSSLRRRRRSMGGKPRDGPANGVAELAPKWPE